MLDIVLEKMDDDPDTIHSGVRAYLLAEPELGKPLVFVRQNDSQRVITSAIASVFVRGLDELVVRTANSVYRIWIICRRLQPVSSVPRAFTPSPA